MLLRDPTVYDSKSLQIEWFWSIENRFECQHWLIHEFIPFENKVGHFFKLVHLREKYLIVTICETTVVKEEFAHKLLIEIESFAKCFDMSNR